MVLPDHCVTYPPHLSVVSTSLIEFFYKIPVALAPCDAISNIASTSARQP